MIRSDLDSKSLAQSVIMELHAVESKSEHVSVYWQQEVKWKKEKGLKRKRVKEKGITINCIIMY